MSDQSRLPTATHRDRMKSCSVIAEILELEDEAWQLYVRGHTCRQIAKALNQSSNWANLTIHRLLELRESDRQPAALAHVEKLLDEIALIRQSAWSGWQRSQADKTRRMEKTKEQGPRGGGGNELTVTTEAQAGDASFLRVLIECNKRESALRGIERPTALLFRCLRTNVDLDTLIEQIEEADAQAQQAPLAPIVLNDQESDVVSERREETRS